MFLIVLCLLIYELQANKKSSSNPGKKVVNDFSGQYKVSFITIEYDKILPPDMEKCLIEENTEVGNMIISIVFTNMLPMVYHYLMMKQIVQTMLIIYINIYILKR